MSKVYIIAGCNGAGKSTASYTMLPEIFNEHIWNKIKKIYNDK